MENREADLIWAAGFVDGEGCLTIQRTVRSGQSAYFQPLIDVAQIKPEPIEVLVALFGGRLCARTRGGRTYHYWRLYGQKAADACSRLLPYLRVKQDQARVLIALQAMAGPQGKWINDFTYELRQTFWQEIRRLNAGNSARRAERLSELAPTIKGDAIVRAARNKNLQTGAEMTPALKIVS